MKGLLPLLLLLAACSVPFEPGFKVTRYEPLGWYEAEWKDLQLCTGLRGRDFSAIGWWVTSSEYVPWQGKWYRGISYIQSYDIVIGYPWIDGRYLVRHEMVHLLAQQPGHEGLWWQCLDIDNPPDYY